MLRLLHPCSFNYVNKEVIESLAHKKKKVKIRIFRKVMFKMILSIRREKYVRLFQAYFTCYHSSNSRCVSSGAKLLYSGSLYACCLELNFDMCSIVLRVPRIDQYL